MRAAQAGRLQAYRRFRIRGKVKVKVKGGSGEREGEKGSSTGSHLSSPYRPITYLPPTLPPRSQFGVKQKIQCGFKKLVALQKLGRNFGVEILDVKTMIKNNSFGGHEESNKGTLLKIKHEV